MIHNMITRLASLVVIALLALLADTAPVDAQVRCGASWEPCPLPGTQPRTPEPVDHTPPMPLPYMRATACPSCWTFGDIA